MACPESGLTDFYNMNTFAYFPHTESDVREMLGRIGVSSLEDLYSDVPEEFVYKGEYDLPDALSEQEIRDLFTGIADRNSDLKVFVGEGSYDHYTPAVIPYLISRSEFLTAYTPYQSEISQGTLRYIFEYQSMICSLTGLDVSNASMYDGPTAAAEAVRMALACTRKKDTVLVSASLLPQLRSVLDTYASYAGIKLKEIALDEGRTSLSSLSELISEGGVAAAIVPLTNRFGIVEDLSGFADVLHNDKALLVTYCDPSTLGVLKSPAQWGADIAVGDGQSLGLPMMYGGPYVGFLACRSEYMRKLPGRIVGQTADKDGKRCYVLTLQAREQHIRRQKATSNICSNESLMALFVTIYLSVMGPQGLREVNEKSCAGAHYLHKELLATGKFTEVFPSRPFLKEFVLKYNGDADALRSSLKKAGFFAAYPSEEGYLSFCVTEKRTKEEIDALVAAVKSETV